VAAVARKAHATEDRIRIEVRDRTRDAAGEHCGTDGQKQISFHRFKPFALGPWSAVLVP
jgi:hypothetical protein